MASEKVVKFCAERFRDGFNYRIRTQDFTDEEIRKAFILVNPKYWDDLGEYLALLTDDPEVKAHLKGFDSAEEGRQIIARFHELVEEEW
ncbi:MAG: hypothetical protein E7185_09910 [Erysipelotrichaceae bacterium]|nr:hypothetical protein [Erysipelotrichaceae bacterium]